MTFFVWINWINPQESQESPFLVSWLVYVGFIRPYSETFSFYPQESPEIAIAIARKHGPTPGQSPHQRRGISATSNTFAENSSNDHYWLLWALITINFLINSHDHDSWLLKKSDLVVFCVFMGSTEWVRHADDFFVGFWGSRWTEMDLPLAGDQQTNAVFLQ